MIEKEQPQPQRSMISPIKSRNDTTWETQRPTETETETFVDAEEVTSHTITSCIPSQPLYQSTRRTEDEYLDQQQHYEPMNLPNKENGLGEMDASTAPLRLPSNLYLCSNHDRIPALANTQASLNYSLTSCSGSSFSHRTRIRPRQRVWRLLCQRLAIGAMLGGLAVVCFFSAMNAANPQFLEHFSFRISNMFRMNDDQCFSCPKDGIRRRRYDTSSNSHMIDSNWNLNKTTLVTKFDPSRRTLAASPSSPTGSANSMFNGENDDYKDTQLVIAGKMSVDDAPCNIAQYNLKKSRWSLTERIQLSLYNSYSGGEVYSLLANHTVTRHNQEINKEEEFESKNPQATFEGSGSLL
ncbi:hypothetical protein IV203_012469 [Nitzschia inconspicua]|uniref:Uncharacterized protein n=1 Tax=Nitzschia inconspicua TaxID=303405 RepID=A0A9K3PJC0_9STRA|nr:hypothetical protein IV203_012469 [Nitzschia inconspicua]